ncbi:xanthine permease [Plasticicumulans lactativorans]|uniref:Xanthine permease n=1 Tax=Plasticicumulans lactativorans TaxID=1133106 RepID=A0A4R2L277_9GAMM|nr:nucleobase:cation symporter-2 family protein [Plasticicumulans lactativorans]TCO79742.1 xanthine permease [Plasticicumulans lactativorans]
MSTTNPAVDGVDAVDAVDDAAAAAAAAVDERLPLSRLLPLGLQHVLVMYAGAVAVPLIIGRAAKLSEAEIAILINSDLLACGLATLLQSLGLWKFGIRLPVMMGISFATVSPMLAIMANPELGLLGVLGATIFAGAFGILVAPFVGRLLPFFPSVVTGTIITVIGITVMRVGIGWAAGGQPTLPNGTPNPAYGDPLNLGIAFAVLAVILLVLKFGRGFLANISILLGLVFGYVVCLGLGKVDLSALGQASWLGVVAPMHFGMPKFDLLACFTLSLIMLVVMVESLGMFLALGSITGVELSRERITAGLRVDGMGTLLGGFLNTFMHTSFSQNVGLVAVTGVRSRWVCVVGGVILMSFGFLPKMAYTVASIPQYVLGGAGLVMFGMVAATGMRILASALLKSQANLYIAGISISLGMIPLMADKFFSKLPHALEPLLHSGILLATISAIVLNVMFNGVRYGYVEAREQAAAH